MAGTITVPGIGPVKKGALGLAGAGVGVIGIIWYVRSRRASSAAAAPAAATGQQTDAAGNTGVIDPATGFVYGSAEDTQALATLNAATSPYDTSSLGAGLSGYYYGTGTATSTTPPGPGNFSDNAEWAQYAEQYMISNLGADPATAGAALGKYLTGQPVTSAQQTIIQEAIAIAQYPPQAGAGGDPPGIILSATQTGPSSGGTSTAPTAAPTSLSATPHGATANFGWSAVAGATGYELAISGASSHDLTETGNHAANVALGKGKYTWKVRATNPAGPGPWSASKSLTM